MTLDMEHVRLSFPILSESVHGKPLIYLDTAASAQKPAQMLDAADRFTRSQYANVKRSAHQLAEYSTRAYEHARQTVAGFLNCDADEIVFTSGTTDALNKAARAIEPLLSQRDGVIVSVMEHHSSFVPWQQIARRRGATFTVVPLIEDYRLDMNALMMALNEKTRIVAVAHVSNVLGTTNPIAQIAKIVRERAPNALLIVDGAQAAPHGPVDVRALDCDLYAFSGHKLYGPTGIGVLYGKRKVLSQLEPPVWGGEMVSSVTVEKTTWADIPARFEAGTPNIIGAVGLGAAIRWLESLGWDAIRAHEHALITYALKRLVTVPGLRLIGPADARARGGQFSFTLGDWHPHDLAAVLDGAGIAVRAGHHCAQPLHDTLGIRASVRASIAVHTTIAEIDALVDALTRAAAPAPADRSAVFDGPLTEEEEVVRDDIIDHATRPRNKRAIAGVTPVLGKNPSCGDTVQVFAVLSEGRVTDLSFEGHGCAISQAAMSKLTKELKGKSSSEILAFGLDHMNRLLGLDFSTKPVRAKCAMLGLRATQEAVRRIEGTKGDEV